MASPRRGSSTRMSLDCQGGTESCKNRAMPDALILSPTDDPRVFRSPDGDLMSPPREWSCLPPGDAGLTRRVKAATTTWTVQEKVGRRMFSRGVWADGAVVERIRQDLEAERARLSKAIAAAEKERDSLAGRLSNPSFVERAKPEAVEKARADHAEKSAEAERLGAALKRLG